MATYIINAASGTPGSPWATEGTGAQSFKQLFDDITQSDGDIVEVYDNAEIDDTAGQSSITKDITIRSHSSNTSKPIVKLNNTGRLFTFSPGATGVFKVQQIRMYKDGPSADSEFLYLGSGAFSSPEISECEFWVDDPASKGSQLHAIWWDKNSSFSGLFTIKKNRVVGLRRAIYYQEQTQTA